MCGSSRVWVLLRLQFLHNSVRVPQALAQLLQLPLHVFKICARDPRVAGLADPFFQPLQASI
ncbi:hypothetical protein KR51_00020510 [Rubidibacter lacunae KORDI 51-2]|uniref:Uncharacterized protein n=1 Tax=Rubidibacter lacunae KORDI 51-2 TaxID=582515 RepID=U5DLL6_9CHRO|nr:hypothetical protein KR51_00020510 [Rubidibacter lacunae KORDI 51-2]